MDNGMVLEGMDWYTGKDLMKTVGRGIAMFNSLGFNKELDYFIIDDTGLG